MTSLVELSETQLADREEETMSSSIVLCLAVTLGLGLSGCGSSTGGHATTPSTPAATRTARTAPAAASTYADRLQSRFHADGADGMVAAAGSLWAKTDLGHVVRIDPRSNKVTAEIVVDKYTGQSFYCQGIGATRRFVWSCATRSDGVGLAQIDPSRHRVVRVVRAGKVFDQLALPVTSRGIWVLTGDGTQVSRVDPVSGKATSFRLGARCQQVGASESRVVATSVVGGNVVVLDADTGVVRKRLEVADPRMAVVVGDDIWVDSSAGLTRFSDDLGTRTVYPGMTAGQGGDLFSDGRSVWLRESDGTIFRVDAYFGRVLERITPSHPLSGGSLVVAYGSIWTTDSERGWVIRLRQD
ncbi:MAG: hypothetical protein ACJ72L_04955 [Marmoricola sp.]